MILPVRRHTLALLLAGLAMFGPFSIDTIFPAFPLIASDLGATAVKMQQTISVYLIAYALTSLLHGPLSDAHGRKPVIVGGIVVFILASIGCALAVSFTQLLLFRALQGASAGAGLIVGRAVIRDCYEGDDAQRLMSAITMIFGTAPAIAPIVGGWILAMGDWRVIFWFLALFAALLIPLCLFTLPETHRAPNRVPFSLGHLLRTYRAIASNRRFLLLAIAGSFNFGALFLYIASAPVFVITLLKLNAQQFAWFFIPAISGMMLGAFLSGRLAGRITSSQAVHLGFTLTGIAALSNLGYNLLADHLAVPWAVLPVALNAVGIALVFPIITLAIIDMYPKQRGAASSLQAFIALTANALIAGVLSPAVSYSGFLLAATAALWSSVAWLLWQLSRRL